MLYVYLWCVGITLAVPLENGSPRVAKCGYESCVQHDPDMLNVHIVPHTHDDVGWLKTVDQYYYGHRNNIQKAGVQYILDTVVKELWEDPRRRFIYVESFFFFKWWDRQTEEMRDRVRTLVSEGRLQFTGGAWSMNDEAASHYQSTIDQFTYGLRMLNATFGECGLPRVGWQIDPFGHSREFASLVAAMGYDGLFLGRIDYQDKSNRANENRKTMEMVWRGDDDLGAPSDIFTGVLYNTYSPPAGFCFDIECSDDPIIDDVRSPDYNVDRRVSDFIGVIKHMSRSYASKNILVTMGDDFQYQDARTWFTNLDLLIKYTNLKLGKEGQAIKLFYSTPQCYLKAVKDSQPTLPTKSDDFFPYASDGNSYWTGYFTSRPTTKYFERLANNYLQMAKQLQVLADLKPSNIFVLNELKSAMGIMQHHDAITGTEKQHVANDYERILTNAIEDSLVIPREAFSKLMQAGPTTPSLDFKTCRLNESSCGVAESSNTFIVTVYNHLAWRVNDSIRIPVKKGNFEVYTPNGDKITSQLVPIPESVKNIPTRVSEATHEIVFIAYLHPLSYKNYYIRKLKPEKRRRREGRIKKEKTHQRVFNVNDYWKTIREKPLVEIKHLEESVEKNSLGENVRIPDRPVYETGFEKPAEYQTLNVDVMRDAKDYNYHTEEMNRMINEARRLVQQAAASPRAAAPRPRPRPGQFHSEELRMLSDEPMVVESTRGVTWENEHLTLNFDLPIKEITASSKKDDATLSFGVKFGYYIGAKGDNSKPSARSSGAYIFRPTSTVPEDITIQNSQVTHGPVVKEVYLETDNDISSTLRLYEGLNFIENDWVVGPINVTDKLGKEFVVDYVSNLINNGEFFTDSNGRQMLRRKLGERPQWNVSIEEPVGGNYYPVTNQIGIKNDSVKFSVLTDRSEGGSSLREGEIELMLHRRLLNDDAFGVGEALNESVLDGIGLVVRGRHRIVLGRNDKEHNVVEKKLVKQFDLQPQILVADAKDLTLADWLKLKNGISFANELPTGLHLLTLEPLGENKLLIRLENYLEKTDRENANININLNSILKNINLKSFRETALAADRWIEDVEHWVWKTEDLHDENKKHSKSPNTNEGFSVEIKPKQIRTFIADYEFKK